MVGAVTQASETVSSEDRKRRLAEEYSTIPDVIDRFFLAFKGDQAMAQQCAPCFRGFGSLSNLTPASTASQQF